MRTTQEILVSYLYILDQLLNLSCVTPLYIFIVMTFILLFSLFFSLPPSMSARYHGIEADDGEAGPGQDSLGAQENDC